MTAGDAGRENQSSICCLILTFNRVPALRRCIEAVLRQTRAPDSILIVDNSSTDTTAEFLASLRASYPEIQVVRLPENLGPAGGYASGLRWILGRGHTYAWLMDDDVFPDQSCLQELNIEMAGAVDRIVFPSVVDPLGRPQAYPAWAGVLIPVALVERAGLPRTELFWWTEDTEYLQWRLPRLHGAATSRSRLASVVHGVDDGRSKPAWKYYYEVRNTLYYRIYVQTGQRRRRWVRASTVVLRSLARAAWEERRWLKLRMVSLGLWHGLRGRLGKQIDPATVLDRKPGTSQATDTRRSSS